MFCRESDQPNGSLCSACDLRKSFSEKGVSQNGLVCPLGCEIHRGWRQFLGCFEDFEAARVFCRETDQPNGSLCSAGDLKKSFSEKGVSQNWLVCPLECEIHHGWRQFWGVLWIWILPECFAGRLTSPMGLCAVHGI